MTKIEIARIEHGYQTIMGTNWPIESFVTRHAPKRWVLTARLCNGIPDYSETYTTKREALKALEMVVWGD